MPIDPRTLASTPTKKNPSLVFQAYDGGGPQTSFADAIDGGSPANTGPVINDTQGTP